MTSSRPVIIVERQQIQAFRPASVADIIRLVASVDVRARGDRGGQTDFSIRGANFGQALVLVDGVRLNDPQTGHHNGDIPVPVEMIERLEVVLGAGSSLFGADAVGGVINIITRSTAHPSASLEAGSYGLVGGQALLPIRVGSSRSLVAVEGTRSRGFMVERELQSFGVSSKTQLGSQSHLLIGFVGKSFGANGFYGPSPSHEATNQFLAALTRSVDTRSPWKIAGTASYRTHGDRFLWDARQPGIAENQHRTHVALGTLRATRPTGPKSGLTVGGEGAAETIRSTALGNRHNLRLSTFAEWRWQPNRILDVDAAVRVDRYTEFGTALSPALGIVWRRESPVRVRANIGRSFRTPTFTERYYSDPAHIARASLRPETGWNTDVGLDLAAFSWSFTASTFYRAERSVIDWLRQTATERWQTYNIRNVSTRGVELSAQRILPWQKAVRLDYTRLHVDSPDVNQLSKYTLDYAPQRLTMSAALPPVAGIDVSSRIDFVRRSRSTGVTDDTIVGLQLSKRFGLYEVRASGSNLLDTDYQEILGVAMPGRTIAVSLAVGVAN